METTEKQPLIDKDGVPVSEGATQLEKGRANMVCHLRNMSPKKHVTSHLRKKRSFLEKFSIEEIRLKIIEIDGP